MDRFPNSATEGGRTGRGGKMPAEVVMVNEGMGSFDYAAAFAAVPLKMTIVSGRMPMKNGEPKLPK